MAVVNKAIGLGTVLEVKTSGGFVEVAGLLGIDGPDVDSDMIDTSTIDCTSIYKTFQPGQVDSGSLTLNLAYGSTNDSQMSLAGLLQNREQTDFKLQLSTSGTPKEEFKGYLKSMGRGLEIAGMVTRSVVVKLTESPGWPVSTGEPGEPV